MSFDPAAGVGFGSVTTYTIPREYGDEIERQVQERQNRLDEVNGQFEENYEEFTDSLTRRFMWGCVSEYFSHLSDVYRSSVRVFQFSLDLLDRDEAKKVYDIVNGSLLQDLSESRMIVSRSHVISKSPELRKILAPTNASAREQLKPFDQWLNQSKNPLDVSQGDFSKMCEVTKEGKKPQTSTKEKFTKPFLDSEGPEISTRTTSNTTRSFADKRYFQEKMERVGALAETQLEELLKSYTSCEEGSGLEYRVKWDATSLTMTLRLGVDVEAILARYNQSSRK